MRTKEGKGAVSYHLIHLPPLFFLVTSIEANVSKVRDFYFLKKFKLFSQLNSSLCLRGGMVLTAQRCRVGGGWGAV